MATHTTRESWLAALADAMRPTFTALGYAIPEKLRVSAGWPCRNALSDAKGNRAIGQCFAPVCSADGATELFISPVLADPMRVADVLAHELAHAAVGTEHGHKAPFARAAHALGLEGKATATVAGEAFMAWAKPVVEALGPYPHAALDVTKGPVKKQATRQLKVVCPACGYTARTTRKWLDETGAPLCPCNSEPMEEEVKGA